MKMGVPKLILLLMIIDLIIYCRKSGNYYIIQDRCTPVTLVCLIPKLFIDLALQSLIKTVVFPATGMYNSLF